MFRRGSFVLSGWIIQMLHVHNSRGSDGHTPRRQTQTFITINTTDDARNHSKNVSSREYAQHWLLKGYQHFKKILTMMIIIIIIKQIKIIYEMMWHKIISYRQCSPDCTCVWRCRHGYARRKAALPLENISRAAGRLSALPSASHIILSARGYTDRAPGSQKCH